MAEDAQLGDDSDKKFKCHSNEKVSKIAICIICESVYHPNDFTRLKKHKFVSDMLVVYNEHNVEKLTSKRDFQNIEVTENAHKVIAEIKIYERDRVKEELRNNISLNKTREIMLLDETIIDDDLNLLRVENDLLKQLNDEL
ncbi:hypothetical protein EVAR_43613_1 [Eumeta japonica]|uniref:Uncharacterized protein n=1 Tax=Eumeta variegata TaxID=151549 RepID=A0A4C1XHK7_EUMVA|nr:hypothetical protein EVAR_43613_1 [Eumeta japonica]